MHKVNHSALLPYSAAQIFKLVDDIESYPEFLPWCVKTDIHQRVDSQVEATISLKKGPFTHSFTTKNTNKEFDAIRMELVEGPFKHFDGLWQFEVLADSACKVTLMMEFEIENGLLNLAFAKFFDQVANAMLDAFSSRAREVYPSES